MIIDRKVERYVQEVTEYLPGRMRGEAEHELTELLLDLIRDHANGKEPDILDARAVIDEMGSPELMAMSYLETKGETKTEASPFTEGLDALGDALNLDPLTLGKMNRMVTVMLMIFSVLAVVLVGFGIVALSTHAITNVLPIFLGCVLGLVAVAGRSVLARQA